MYTYTQVRISGNGKTVVFYTGDGYGHGGKTRRYRNVTQASLERLFRILKFTYRETRDTASYTSEEWRI